MAGATPTEAWRPGTMAGSMPDVPERGTMGRSIGAGPRDGAWGALARTARKGLITGRRPQARPVPTCAGRHVSSHRRQEKGQAAACPKAPEGGGDHASGVASDLAGLLPPRAPMAFLSASRPSLLPNIFINL